MNCTPFTEGRWAAECGYSDEDNPYEEEFRASQWEEGFYSVQPLEPKQKIKRGKPQWN